MPFTSVFGTWRGVSRLMRLRRSGSPYRGGLVLRAQHLQQLSNLQTPVAFVPQREQQDEAQLLCSRNLERAPRQRRGASACRAGTHGGVLQQLRDGRKSDGAV